jgi:hypothetical protein
MERRILAGGTVEALVPITFFMSVAAVMILRPVTRKLGLLLEAMSRERMAGRNDDSARTLALMEQMARRMEMMEDRLDFTERLVARTPRPAPERGDERLELRRG